jgi:hypothetical protein
MQADALPEKVKEMTQVCMENSSGPLTMVFIFAVLVTNV